MKKVIVTGASKGLGLAIVRRLIADGFFIIGVARTMSDGLSSALGEGKSAKGIFRPFDLSDLEGISGLAKELHREQGAIFGLVNNAATGGGGVLGTMHQTDIEATLRLNLHSPILLTKYIGRYMLLKKEGRIINISSIVANTGYNGLSVYAATKAGLIGFTTSLSRELGKYSICVNAVLPGYMETDMTEGITSDQMESIVRRTPESILPTTDSVASAVAYLLSPPAAFIKGQTLVVDNGATA